MPLVKDADKKNSKLFILNSCQEMPRPWPRPIDISWPAEFSQEASDLS